MHASDGHCTIVAYRSVTGSQLYRSNDKQPNERWHIVLASCTLTYKASKAGSSQSSLQCSASRSEADVAYHQFLNDSQGT